MAFLIGLLVNAILLSIPIGASLGTMIAIRPFRNERVKETTNETAILEMSFCDATHTFHQFSQNKHGVNFTINSNEILTELESTLCLTTIQNQNNTYLSNSTAPEFSITWEYPFTPANASSAANETKPLIHAFPQATLQDIKNLPITLEDLGLLSLDFSWTMGIGDENAPATSPRRLGAQETNASVALDMYIDADPDKAAEGGKAAFEMIILFAMYGLQDPVGFGNGTIVTTTKLGNTEFNLFAGQNDNLQNVFSWVATEPITDFTGDISPLFNTILNLGSVKGFADLKVDLPSVKDYLGYVGFGTQAFNSLGHVTFWVPKLRVDLRSFAEL